MDGSQFRSIRKALGYTQRELAKLMVTTPSTISHWERLLKVPKQAKDFINNLGPKNPPPPPTKPTPTPISLPPQLQGELYALYCECLSHLDYCGWGDSWERECATHHRLPQRTEQLLAKIQALLDPPK